MSLATQLFRTFDVSTSTGAALLRAGAGAWLTGAARTPELPLELYEFEGCPFCRKVREALSMLDLEARIYPCPKEGPRYRPVVIGRGGKAQFPYLVDPNTGKEMYESSHIVRYLFETYGTGAVPLSLAAGALTDISVSLASIVRLGRGTFYRSARSPDTPLELYSFEASPYCRLVRETLSTLELPYLLHNVARGSPRRRELVERAGKMQVPYLIDANTGTELFESGDIVAYLERTYALDGPAASASD